MWDEVAITPRLLDQSPWDEKMGPSADVTWAIDSEFGCDKEKEFSAQLDKARQREARKAKEEGLEVDAAVHAVDPLVEEAGALGLNAPNVPTANIQAMSEREFEAYLRRLRELRPKFQRYLELKYAIHSPKKPQKSTWERSQHSITKDHKEFLSAQMHLKYDSADASTLR